MSACRRYGERESRPIPVWNGLLDHRDRIQGAVWTYLWILDAITEERDGVGLVYGGAPVKISQIPGPARSVRRDLRHLAVAGYIRLRRTPYGFRIEVTNSHKFGIWHANKRSANLATLSEEIGQSGRTDRPTWPLQTGQSGRNKEDAAIERSNNAKEKPPAPATKPPAPVRQATDYAYQSFERHHGQPPSWSKADYAQAAALFKRMPGLTAEEFIRRWENYIDSSETFTRKQGGSLKYFCSGFDRFIAGPVVEAPARKGNGNGRRGFSIEEQAAALGARPRPAN